ncbi:hypothetical protein C8J55DRAFT_485570 [Lentinula edodes]|uniref:Phosphotransferase n=1 Tax=Lentinula lateritia TaxID=40482 RepID=A0A9W9AXI0_9AGAR|nr:hypothetical protein C8J55DRAFT_485570 [Lentinula edodes]
MVPKVLCGDTWTFRMTRGVDLSIRTFQGIECIVRWVCHLVARRAALLSGVAVAAVLIQTGRAGVLGGGDGEEKEGEGEGVNGENENGENGVNENEISTNGKKTEEEKIGVGVDGSFDSFASFDSFGTVERRVDIGLAKDGSGVGAALCALQALKQEQGQQV